MAHGLAGRIGLGLLLAAGVAGGCRPADGGALNVVVILADDLGWRDVGYQGSRYPTPAIDRLAAEGLVFDRAYAAAPSCSPTRAALLTGRHPARLGLTHAIRNRDYKEAADPGTKAARPGLPFLPVANATHLPPDVTTIAGRLQAAGYATGFVGKWHVGLPPHGPEAHGFGSVRSVGYFSAAPYSRPWRFIDNPGEGDDQYLTDLLTSDAVDFLRAHRDGPFFLWLGHFAVHGPWQAKPEQVRRLSTIVDPTSDQPSVTYGAMIASLDEGVGRITAELERLGLTERTLVLFTSDNGPTLEKDERLTSTAPLRGEKSELYEGGLRVPLVARWPGTTPAGTRTDVRWDSMDLYPTLLALCGLEREPGEAPDGRDLAAVLRGGPPPGRDPALVFHVPHQPPRSSILDGDLKLVRRYGGQDELYDLGRDPGERNDLTAERPGEARRLAAELQARLDAMGAARVEPNPDYDPALAPAPETDED